MPSPVLNILYVNNRILAITCSGIHLIKLSAASELEFCDDSINGNDESSSYAKTVESSAAHSNSSLNERNDSIISDSSGNNMDSKSICSNKSQTE